MNRYTQRDAHAALDSMLREAKDRTALLERIAHTTPDNELRRIRREKTMNERRTLAKLESVAEYLAELEKLAGLAAPELAPATSDL